MLRLLSIQNFALIDQAEVEFANGLTVLTGETGAGKSILFDALQLLAGARSTAGLIRKGRDRADLQAVLEYPEGHPAEAWLTEQGLQPDEPGNIIVRRELQAAGRTRAWINGRLVTAGQLSELADFFLAIHDQGEQQELLQLATQRDLFDEFAGLDKERAAVGGAYQAVLDAEAQLEKLRGRERERIERLDFVRFQVQELSEAGLTPGEWEELESEKGRLEHVEELAADGAKALTVLWEGEPDSPAAADLAGVAREALERMEEADPSLHPMVESLEEITARLDDLGRELSRYLAGLEGDPERLNELNARLDVLSKMLRKYGPKEEDAVRRHQELEAELEELENLEVATEKTMRDLAERRRELKAAGEMLSSKRRKAANPFARKLEEVLRDLSLPKVRVSVSLKPNQKGVAVDENGSLRCGREGLEEVEILFSANVGEDPMPLRKVASGGELSRIMLALRSISAEKGGVGTMVFDEADAGLSGEAARRVGKRLAELGARGQVLSITHQPSVAAAAHHHFLIEKKTAGKRTITEIRHLDDDLRETEIARLLGGGELSETGRKLASELLKQG